MVTGGIDESRLEYENDQQLEESETEDCEACPAGTLSSKFDRTDTSINTNPLPNGKYTLIGIDIDTTGRRLIDEIVQISAYTPEHQYSQYIMPLMNLNPAARQRHQVRVITVGFFRMLKSMQTYRVVKTKTEVSALNEFILWLEERRSQDPGSDGVVLIYHEQRKFVPYMVIEALKKYNLLDRFAATVKSFANGFKLAEEKCSKTIKYFSIRQLANLVLDADEAKDGFEGNAAYRARLAYQLTRRLSKDDSKVPAEDVCHAMISTEQSEGPKAVNDAEQDGECADADATGIIKRDGSASSEADGNHSTEDENLLNSTDVDAVTGHLITVPEPQPRSRPTTEAEREHMCTVLCELASPITCEISELDEQEKILLRQNSLRPVFLQYFKTTIYHRVKAVTYRRVLAEYGHDFASLMQMWTDQKREGLEEVISKITELKEDERNELIELLDCHFDPEKQQLKPVVKRVRHRSSRGRLFFANKDGNAANTSGGNFTNNNTINKENRKPMARRNSNNNISNNVNSNVNDNNNSNNKNMAQVPNSPNGGKKQRQQRRRRNNPNKQNGQNFNESSMIQTGA
ncbi:maternal protein exuperantia [Sabethes cyaneus]|uniref:maternal protein exuperantia n=1 Tax=Sabethes cyaneus TaxID=53552 RepID=UPI00237E489D|nr:maternal protein exuperantia [Sabethes cyaneus]